MRRNGRAAVSAAAVLEAETLSLADGFGCEWHGASLCVAGQLPCAVTANHVGYLSKSRRVENACCDSAPVASLAMDENDLVAVELIEPLFQVGKRNGDRSWDEAA